MLGSRIASLRKSAGLSQEELARRIEVSTSTVAMYEQGRRVPSCAVLLVLSQVFGVTVQSILSDDEPVDSAASTLPELIFQSRIGLSHVKKQRNSAFSDQETAVLLAALLTMEDK